MEDAALGLVDAAADGDILLLERLRSGPTGEGAKALIDWSFQRGHSLIVGVLISAFEEYVDGGDDLSAGQIGIIKLLEMVFSQFKALLPITPRTERYRILQSVKELSKNFVDRANKLHEEEESSSSDDSDL